MVPHQKSIGFIYLLRGFHLLLAPGIKRYVLIPLVMNVILFSLFLGFGVHFIDHYTNLLPHWLHWLSWFFNTIFILAALVILAYVFTLLTNLISAPFNSLLAEKVELMITGKRPYPNDTFRDAIKDIPRSLKQEFKKILYYLPRAIILLILFVIPGINIIASLLWFIFTCWMMAIEYLSYPMDNHKIPFQKTKKYLRAHYLSSLSFGCGVTMVSMIPIINFTVMPAAVIGATLMYIEQQK